MKNIKLFTVIVLLLITTEFVQAQHQPNVITTAVPFLTYSPDARATAMGECGVATDADAFSMFYNPAKYAFMKNEHTMIASGINLWPGLFNINFPLHMYGVFAQKIGKSTVAASFRYYKMNDVEFVDQYNQTIGVYSPREFAIDASYSYRFGEYLSAGLAVRSINSNLAQNQSDYAGSVFSVAGDIGVYYNRPVGGIVDLSLGASITNIGPKMNYYTSSGKDFLPTTMRLGSGVKINFNQYHALSVYLQFSKLLVPTPPIINYQTGEMYGYDNDVSFIKGIIQSFYDAPGYALNYETMQLEHIGTFYEELCEINSGMGIEYSLFNHGFFRMGCFHEPAIKGNRNKVYLGAGMHFGIFGMDMSYTIPVGTKYGTNPYGNVFRWDMYFAF